MGFNVDAASNLESKFRSGQLDFLNYACPLTNPLGDPPALPVRP